MVVVVLGLVGFVYYTVVVKTLGPMSAQDEPLEAIAAGGLAGVYTIIVQEKLISDRCGCVYGVGVSVAVVVFCHGIDGPRWCAG